MDGNDVNSFWDVDQYRRVIKRVENGYRSCDNFLSMVQERAEIELRYAKSVRKWTEKWSGVVEKGMEYGSSLDSWRSCLQEGVVVAQLHEECKLKIMGENGPFYNMYKWKKEHYHKGAFGSLQEAREANDGFSAAQKEYSRLLTKTESAKKAYHASCVSAHKARLFAEEETRDESVRPEFRRKLQQRASKLALQQEKLKQRYLKRVMKCSGSAKDHYVQEMTGELTKWQSLERVRLDTLHAQLILFTRAVDCGARYSLEDLYRRLEETIGQADSVRDVHEWDAQYGTGCPQHWPRFEEMDVDELDAAAYADVERKTSFGNALMHRRRQRSKHRRAHHNTYSSMTDIDEEGFFSSDSFDSTSTESEDVHSENQGLMRNSNHAQRSRHQAVLPETHAPYPHQPYGHHVTNLSNNYGGQLESPHLSGRTSNHQRHHRKSTSRHDADLAAHDSRKVRSDHRQSVGHRQYSHHSPPHDIPKQNRQNYSSRQQDSIKLPKQQHSTKSPRQQHITQSPKQQHITQSPRPKAYQATQWHTNHTWQPVAYDVNRESGGTPPTRDTIVPPQNPLLQPNASVVGSYPQIPSDQLLSASGSNQRTIGTPIQSFHQQVNVQPQYEVPTVATYKTPTSGHNAQTVQGHVQANVATTNYQAAATTGHPTTSDTQQANANTPTSTLSWWHLQNANQQATSWHTEQTTPRSSEIQREGSMSGRHERHTTVDQAKQLLHLDDGEFMVRALYDFKAGTRDEIPLKRGEVLVQAGKHSENGWAYGRNLEKSGIFPASYVQVVR